jgi:hypothetical protein
VARTIPAAPVREVVDEFLAGYGEGRMMEGWALLAEGMGYRDGKSAQSSIPRVLAGEYVGAVNRPDFDAEAWVDRLLTVLDVPQVWARLTAGWGGGEADDAEHDATCGECGQIIDWEDPTDLAVRIELGERVNGRRRWSWWTLCALCFAESGIRPKVPGRIPPDVLLELYRAYLQERVGVERLAEERGLAARYGFSSAAAAASAVWNAWVRCAWPTYPAATALQLNRKAELTRKGFATLRISAAHARALHAVYERDGVGMSLLAEHVWKRLGFRTPAACASAIRLAFLELGLPTRSREEAQLRRGEAVRRLSIDVVERLWALYAAGSTAREICERFHVRLGYDDPARLRGALEYAWKRRGHKLRSNREAELLSRARPGRARCRGVRDPKDGSRPRPCTQRPAKGSEFCFGHDPKRKAERDEILARMHSRIQRPETIEWALVRPHLEPLLVPRPDPRGRARVYETASGALARHTGVDPGICSRLVRGKQERITIRRANQLLAPLGLTVETLPRELPLAA